MRRGLGEDGLSLSFRRLPGVRKISPLYILRQNSIFLYLTMTDMICFALRLLSLRSFANTRLA